MVTQQEQGVENDYRQLPPAEQLPPVDTWPKLPNRTPEEAATFRQNWAHVYAGERLIQSSDETISGGVK